MSGKPIKSQGSIADSMNEGLRAARRSGKSFDYLAGEGDEQRNAPRKKFDYHDSASPNARGKSYDYLDADQNRRGQTDAVKKGEVKKGEEKNRKKAKSFGDAALNSSDSDNEEVVKRRSKVGVANYHGNRYEDSDSELEDEAWLAEQLSQHLPGIINPEDEPLVAAKTANAGPIGLLGFGMTTVLLNLVNTGHYELCTVVPAMGICFGGGAQFIAGLLEWSRGNTFGYVAFTSYGAFWASLVCVWMLPNASIGGPPGIAASSGYFIGTYLIIWGIYSFMMMCCTLRMNLAIFLVFLTVVLLFLLLGGGHMAENPNAVKAAGYEGIVCGSLALYLAFAEVLNEVWDRTILPIVPMTQLLSCFNRKEKEEEEEEEEKEKEAEA